MNQHYFDFLKRATAKHGSNFSDASLAFKFIPYFRTGQRIRVKYYGETLTGTVGVTTGWKPVFLLMRTRRSIGSSITLDHTVPIIAVQNARGKYIQGGSL